MPKTLVALAALVVLVPVAADANQFVYRTGLAVLAPLSEHASLALLGSAFFAAAALLRRRLGSN